MLNVPSVNISPLNLHLTTTFFNRLFVVAPIVRLCDWSLFCCALSSFANERAGCFTVIVFLMSSDS